MNKNVIAILERMADNLNKSYQSCSSDRGQLSKIEWDLGPESPSVLGEMELKTDTLMGYVRSVIHAGKISNKTEVLRELKKNSIYDSMTISSWMKDEGQKYKKYAEYLLCYEELRKVFIDYLISEKV